MKNLNVFKIDLTSVDVDAPVKLKMAAPHQNAVLHQACWINPDKGILALLVDDHLVRIFNIDTEELYILEPPSDRVSPEDKFITCCYEEHTRSLLAATPSGKTCVWRFYPDEEETANKDANTDRVTYKIDDLHTKTRYARREKQWEFAFFQALDQDVTNAHWGPGPQAKVFTVDNGHIVQTTRMLEPHSLIVNGVAAIHLGPREIALERMEMDSVLIKTGVKIVDMSIDEDWLIAWNGRCVEVYTIARKHKEPRLELRFDFASSCMAVHKESVYICCENFVYVTNLKGTIKQALPFSPEEGNPCLLSISPSGFLAIATKLGTIKVLDIRGPEAVLKASPWRFTKGLPVSLSVNSDGSAVMIRCLVFPTELNNATPDQIARATIPDTRIHVYSVERGTLFSSDFGTTQHYPVNECWDSKDPRFFCVSLKKLIRDPLDGKWHDSRDRHIEIASHFFSRDKGILATDSFTMNEKHQQLIGCEIPFLFFSVRPAAVAENEPKIDNVLMREYRGLQSDDPATLDAMKNFIFNLTVGNIDEAYRNVRQLKGSMVWDTMAKLCVKTRRMDVMEICLRNMGNLRAMIALRQAKQEPETEAQLAIVAIQLEMYDEAEELLKQCNRYDLLNDFYRSAGKWKSAVQVAKEKDQIHLPSTLYAYAEHMEADGEMALAVQYYEEAGCAEFEIPRLLVFGDRSRDFKRFSETSVSIEIKRKYAQMLESQNNFKEALEMYSAIGDHLSQVRIHCTLGDYAKAEEVVAQTQDPLGAERLARENEKRGNIEQAIKYFSQARRYDNAIRLAIDNEMDTDLMTIALHSTSDAMIKAGWYFEKKALFEKAFTLYRTAGSLNRAIDVCFKGNLQNQLHQIADDISSDADPTLLQQCATFFSSIGEFDKAFNMLIAAGEYDQAFAMCETHRITITERVVQKVEESLQPRKVRKKKALQLDTNERLVSLVPQLELVDGATEEKRKEVISLLARYLHNQGNDQLAAKKYADIGMFVEAVNCLISSKDVERVISFANLCRDNRVYVTVANYLQRLDWRSDPEYLKHIITMYQKAKAYDELVQFYESCAQVEIDEYLEYEKAMMALREALRYQKQSMSQFAQQKTEDISRRIKLIEKFIEAKDLEETNPVEMVSILQSLLNEPDIDHAVRMGDIYSQLIQHFHSVRNMEKAFNCLKKMIELDIQVGPYIEREVVEDICTANHVTPESLGIEDLEDEPEEEYGEGEEEYVDDDDGGFVDDGE
ncbi:putative Intraflagellar transport protein 140 [Blattamonas nauphoetae]|uniref:Intraflagellar transport protein 140 n=1 Tax=Blattamonas nauphoetae TaxID=2049346 RepID=A0ABQ9XP15_9EUKA|nr:putative Intraflagellar transport protein 140 [Blattamonas nauphoetae]